MRTAEAAPNLYVANPIVAALDKNIVPWRKPWSPYGPPKNVVSKAPYTGAVLWYLHSLPYPSNLYITEQQLREVGGAIREGEAGYAPYLNSSANSVPSTEEILYNVSQCDGIPEEMLDQNIIDLYPPTNACAILIVSMHGKPTMKASRDTMCYSVKDDTVYLSDRKYFPSLELYYTTLFEQLIHSTGHPKRLNRQTVNDMAEFTGDWYSPEALVGSIGSGHLSSMVQIANRLPPSSAAYITRWREKIQDDPSMFVRACDEAQRAVDFLLKDNLIAGLCGL